MKNFHTHQLQILQKLMYSKGLSFSRIKPARMEGSLFTFHLDRLIKEGYVSKMGILYVLTKSGKELAGRMDLGDEKIENQAKISVITICKRNKGGKTQYLLYTRLKSPFYNYQGFPTGKVKRGEDLVQAAKRELKEETNLENGKPKLFSILHYKIYDKSNSLLEDRIFFAFRFTNPTGKLISGPEGIYDWVDKKAVWKYLKRPVEEVEELMKDIDNDNLRFVEKSCITEGF